MLLYNILGITVFWTSTVVAIATKACPNQQSSLAASARQWPTPSGEIGNYFSSYSSVHNGVFTNCEAFTTGIPTSLSSDYQAWVTSVNEYSASLESTVAAAQSTCIALVANIVIPLPRCEGDAGSAGGNSGTVTGSTSSPVASSTTAADSGAAFKPHGHDALLMAAVACVGAVGALAIAL